MLVKRRYLKYRSRMAHKQPPPKSFVDLIQQWPSIAEFARETKQPYERVKRWRALNNIKPKYWPAIKAAAWARGWGWVDDTLLARLATVASKERDAA